MQVAATKVRRSEPVQWDCGLVWGKNAGVGQSCLYRETPGDRFGKMAIVYAATLFLSTSSHGISTLWGKVGPSCGWPVRCYWPRVMGGSRVAAGASGAKEEPEQAQPLQSAAGLFLVLLAAAHGEPCGEGRQSVSAMIDPFVMETAKRGKYFVAVQQE